MTGAEGPDEGARRRALVAAWARAKLWVGLPDGPLEVIQQRASGGGGFPPGVRAIYLVTAWNPGGRLLAPGENAARHRELLAALASGGLEHWPAAGYAPDESWVELGVALPGTTPRAALALGGDFGQLALYAWTAERVATLECASGALLAERRWRSRPRSAPPG